MDIKYVSFSTSVILVFVNRIYVALIIASNGIFTTNPYLVGKLATNKNLCKFFFCIVVFTCETKVKTHAFNNYLV